MPVKPDYKWVALSNTTLGVLLATIDGSIVLIAMPSIFRGIHLDPLQPGNSFYLLWMILGFLVVSSVLVVSLGRLGDQYGRVRMYNLGFVVYTLASLLLTIDWLHGRAGADWLISFRIVQGIGAAFLVANSVAILTDAFPANQRGLALGINNVVGISGMFIGLVLGGVLAPISWRLVFLVSVPVGIVGTIWSYRSLREIGVRTRDRIDWAGNLTFAAGLVLVMVGITYGIRPYGSHPMGWTSPTVEGCLAAGVALLALFVVVELRSQAPMFRLQLFRIRAFTFGVLSSFLSAISRGGLMFMLIIWLQGIWLPEHGVRLRLDAALGRDPDAAADDRVPASPGRSRGSSPTATARGRSRPAGCSSPRSASSCSRCCPSTSRTRSFAAILLLMGLSMGAFAAPNRAGVMNSLPAQHRGAGGGMNQTFQNSAQVLVDRDLLHVDDRRALRDAAALARGRPARARRLRPTSRRASSQLPPVSVLFAAFLGYNPAQKLLGPHVLARLPAHSAAAIRGRALLPAPDRGAVPQRPRRGVRLRDRRVSRRRARLLVARRPRRRARGVRAPAARGRSGLEPASRTAPRGRPRRGRSGRPRLPGRRRRASRTGRAPPPSSRSARRCRRSRGPEKAARVPSAAGTARPATMLIEFEFSVSLISAEPRRWRPKRTPVQALGRLVRIASTTTPTSASGTDHACARSVAARTAPTLPATIRQSATRSTTTAPAPSRRESSDCSRR